MRLTKKKAIEISIELWTWLAESGGKEKSNWLGWEKYGEMVFDCPLCSYTKSLYQKGGDIWMGSGQCDECPYYQGFGLCIVSDTAFSKWQNSRTKKARQKYARQFLEQLKELK